MDAEANRKRQQIVRYLRTHATRLRRMADVLEQADDATTLKLSDMYTAYIEAQGDMARAMLYQLEEAMPR